MRLRENIIEKIAKYFSRKPQVIAVYLYGSFAKGEAKKDSDIDLGVVLGKKGRPRAFRIPQVIFSQELSKLLREKVEVQDLSASSLEFSHRVLSEGKLIFCRDHAKRIDFETMVVRKYFDLKPYFEEYYHYLSQIAKKGELNVRYFTNQKTS